MKSSLITSAAFFTICVFCPAQTEGNEQHQKWRQELGSADYQTRVKAMEEIWKSGDEAMAFLERLAASDDPELAIRAATIVQKVKLGINPDTPGAIVDLIDSYLKAIPTERIAVLEKLRNLGEFDFILKLRRGESNQRVVEKMDGIIALGMPRIVRRFLNEEKFAEAKEVLGLSDQFKHMIQLGSLLRITGGLDEEIAKLAESVIAGDSARYLAYLRVKGDSGLLRREAKRLGDQNAEILAALAEGDHEPYFEYLPGNGANQQVGGLSLPNQLYIKWALANHRGDVKAQKKAFESLEYLGRQVSEEEESREAQVDLFRMGYGQQVIDGLSEKYLEKKINYYLMQENYAKARDLIGLPQESELAAWIKTAAEKAEEEIENSQPGPGIDRMIAAARFLEARGLTENATKCVLILFDLTRGKKDHDLGALGIEMFLSAPVSVLTAVAREIEEHEALPASFISQFSGRDKEHLWLYRKIKELFPEMETRELLLNTFSFSSRHLLVPVDRYDEVFEKVLASVVKDESEAQAGLAKLFMVVQYRNREPELLKILNAQVENGAENEKIMGLLALEGGRLNTAAELLGQFVVNAENPNVTDLYQYGTILNKVGKGDGEVFIKKAELFSDGSSAGLAEFSDQHLRFGEVSQSHELLRQALLRSPTLPKPGVYSGMRELLDGLAAGAATLGNWQEALAYREVVALIEPNGGISYGVYYLRNRFQILVARGALAMETGDIAKAESAFVEAHRILPRDGYLANELFPVMREVGLIQLHDKLFAESARHAREVIEMYPKDDNAHNNFAWLASRANRCLDEAEGYLKIALKINPRSAAYLDTMGEIHFARRNRDEALKWSALSLQNQVFGGSANRWELHQQNQRFKSGEFPVE